MTKTYALTSRGVDVRMRHLADCAGPKVGLFYGFRDEWVVRCNRCGERRAITSRELAAIREQLAGPTGRNDQ